MFLTTGGFSLWLSRYRPLKAQTSIDLVQLNSMPDKSKTFTKFLNLAQEQAQKNPYKDKKHPPFLYWGLTHNSFYQLEIPNYPNRLRVKPQGENQLSVFESDKNFADYPARGVIPEIHAKELKFLHEDIKEACICLAQFQAGKLVTKWLGRNALNDGEFWSGTKIIPLTYILHASNQNNPVANPQQYTIQGLTEQKTEVNLPFDKIAQDIVSYQNDHLENEQYSSNSLTGMLKRFVPQEKLEAWFKDITGNQNLTFRGRYGENPLTDQPQLIDSSTEKVILCADPKLPNFCDCNSVSAYDLTRMISLIGWHQYLAKEAQIEGIKAESLDILLKALGNDPARLTDLAIEELGMQDQLKNVVILSKLGNGVTSIRQRTEAVYVALIQGIDTRTQPAKQIMLSMALRGGLALENRVNDQGEKNPEVLERERIELDARMATEVTEILGRSLNYALDFS